MTADDLRAALVDLVAPGRTPDGEPLPEWVHVDELHRLLADHQTTAREGAWVCAVCGKDAADCACRVQPAPVASAAGRLSEEERKEFWRQVCRWNDVPDPFSSESASNEILYAAVERILADRLAAAEQRVAEARAEALEQAADAMYATFMSGKLLGTTSDLWLRKRAADLRAATTEGGGQDG